jgi:hypothetical protein
VRVPVCYVVALSVEKAFDTSWQAHMPRSQNTESLFAEIRKIVDDSQAEVTSTNKSLEWILRNAHDLDEARMMAAMTLGRVEVVNGRERTGMTLRRKATIAEKEVGLK